MASEGMDDLQNNPLYQQWYITMLGSRPFMKTVMLGQVISFLIAGTGFFASLLSNNSISVPVFLMALNYALLAPYLFFRSPIAIDPELEVSSSIFSPRLNLKCPLWLYIAISVIDLEANVIVISAYRYTTITSIMLLDCFSIPCVMLLSYFFLKAKYSFKHLCGTVICLAGMVVIIISDLQNSDSTESAENPFYGDMLCLIGTGMYACSNVIQEKLVKRKDREEYLGMLGLIGGILATCQVMIMEQTALRGINWSVSNIGFMIGFVVCLNLMYSRASSYLKQSDAAYLNLSLLTSDGYAVIFSFVVYGNLVPGLYFVAFSLAFLGLVLYSSVDSPTAELSNQIDPGDSALGSTLNPQHPIYIYHTLPASELSVEDIDSADHETKKINNSLSSLSSSHFRNDVRGS